MGKKQKLLTLLFFFFIKILFLYVRLCVKIHNRVKDKVPTLFLVFQSQERGEMRNTVCSDCDCRCKSQHHCLESGSQFKMEEHTELNVHSLSPSFSTLPVGRLNVCITKDKSCYALISENKFIRMS